MSIKTLAIKMTKKTITTLVLCLFLMGCSALTGEEIARLEINKVSTGSENVFDDEAILELKKGDEIMFWSDMDVTYEGTVELRFNVKIFKDGVKLKQMEIDPTKKNITVGEVKTELMGKTDWSFSGKNSELKINEEGSYTIKAILIASENSSLKVTKAELVIKK